MSETTCKQQTTIQSTEVRSTVFGDGMVVTAADLETAMEYPVEVMQTLVRAFFGCGIVCGLEVAKDTNDAKEPILRIKPGVALDCDGFPLRLCKAIDVDVKRDPCEKEPPTKFCVAIRRHREPEALRNDADACGSDSASRCTPRRMREGVEVRVFPAEPPKGKRGYVPPSDVCYVEDPKKTGPTGQECMKACGDCAHRGSSWVLLACFELAKDQIKGDLELGHRKYIKPVSCHPDSQ